MTLDHASWLERLERERVDILLEWNTVLEALADRYGETAKDATKRCSLLCKIQEDLTERAILVFTGS